jgi:hypothetical protein
MIWQNEGVAQKTVTPSRSMTSRSVRRSVIASRAASTIVPPRTSGKKSAVVDMSNDIEMQWRYRSSFDSPVPLLTA